MTSMFDFKFGRFVDSECEDGKSAIDHKDTRFVFMFLMMCIWASIWLDIVVSTKKQTVFKKNYQYIVFRVLYGLLVSSFLYNMFLICRPWTGILFPSTIIIVLAVIFVSLPKKFRGK